MNNDNDGPIPTARALAEEYVRLGGDPGALNDDLPRLYERIHEDARNGKPRTALAISGGGIRSATFALGIIQELARKGLLQTFDYLSTVSGGGYIGGWLSSFVRRRAGGIEEVAGELAKKPTTPTEPEVKPLRHLREYSNYLTPKLGLMSGDTWSMAANYVRNLLLNWLMLVPLLIAAVILPRLLLGFIRKFPTISDSSYHVVLLVIGVLLLIAIAYLGFTRPVETSAEEREKPRWILTNGAFQTLALVPFLLAAIGFAFLWPHPANADFRWWFGGALGVASLIGALIYAVRYSIATRTQRREDVRAESSDAFYTLKKLVMETVVAIASAEAAAYVLYKFFTVCFAKLPAPFPYPDPKLWATYPPNLPPLKAELYVCLAVPMVLIVYFLQAALFVGFSSWFSEDYDREWWARAAGWIFSAAFIWVVFSALALFGPILIYEFPRIAASIGTITGAYAVLGGKSSKSGGPKSEEKSGKASGFTLSLGVIGTIFAIVVLAALSLGISEVLLRRKPEYKKIGADEQRYANSTYELSATKPTTVMVPGETKPLPGTLKLATAKYPALDLDRYHAFLHLWIVDQAEAKECVVIFLGCLIVAIVSSWFIGVNRFSMHAFYRNRL
ncbi:MAG TPA: patatin-like phospholipase family protein, partial [Thermoanaerobaculia bacterium]|nr:patatin-like phospholipase family protein [Thermoanaerobaculia bacterium]